ncbi:MAG TPA: hypothetical protein VGK36_15955 [Candidatus Angelobacter sp.]|jgi:uncharacterized damage-inducible protein DinB
MAVLFLPFKKTMPDENPGTNAPPQAAPAIGEEAITPSNTAESAEPSTIAEELKPTPSTTRGKTMEIHHPESPIHSTREFLFHMFTVILGILIALGMEGIVEWAHHRALVREARENIATEIRKNKETVDTDIAEIRKREEELNHVIAAMRQLEKDPGSFKHGSLGFHVVNHDLYSTAWQTATVSGAVTYMKYDELNRYTDVYLTQQAFTGFQEQALNQMIAIGGMMEVTMKDRDLKKVPAEKFQTIAQEAYKDLIIQQTLEGISTELSKTYGDILKSM